MPSMRYSAYSPDGKQQFMMMNTAHFTKGELDEGHDLFKRWIKQGRSLAIVKKELKSYFINREKSEPKSVESVVVKPVESVKPVEVFKRKHIDDLKLPENKCMSFCMIGSTRSGKSYAINYIWDKIFKKHLTILMTQSSHADIYKQFQKQVICDGFKKEIIDESMNINKHTANHYPFCIIFDDLVLNGKNDESMTKLLTIGRNCGMSCIISGQKMTMLNSTGRANINYVCCFKQNTESAIEDTIKTFLRSYFPKDMKITDMISMYKELTQDHNFFVIDTLNDEIFISKI